VTLPFDRSPPATHVSYQLLIRVGRPIRLRVGALGVQEFPAGHYLYTGSARRNLEARIRRHLRREKKLRWHIDYLLSSPHAEVVEVFTSDLDECRWNRSVNGKVVVAGFGASDCRNRCGAHLLLLDEEEARRLSP
jgi:Uncharacterized conserved protein